jgi:hypothetical protein
MGQHRSDRVSEEHLSPGQGNNLFLVKCYFQALLVGMSIFLAKELVAVTSTTTQNNADCNVVQE